MEPSWRDYPHLKAKLVAGFVLGAVFVTVFAYVAVRVGGTEPGETRPGLSAVGVLVGWVIVYPIIVLTMVRPSVERYQRERQN